MSKLSKILHINKTEIIPFDTSVEAEYEDGFVLSETEQNDQSAYIAMEMVDVPTGEVDKDNNPVFKTVPTGPNTLNDIVNKRPEADHGKMVRFSVFWNGQRFDMDWTQLPADARPIRLRDGSMSTVDGLETFNGFHACRWGFQYTDENGKNQQFIKELE